MLILWVLKKRKKKAEMNKSAWTNQDVNMAASYKNKIYTTSFNGCYFTGFISRIDFFFSKIKIIFFFYFGKAFHKLPFGISFPGYIYILQLFCVRKRKNINFEKYEKYKGRQILYMVVTYPLMTSFMNVYTFERCIFMRFS